MSAFYERKSECLSERVQWLESYAALLECALDKAYENNRLLMKQACEMNLKARLK